MDEEKCIFCNIISGKDTDANILHQVFLNKAF